MHPQPITEFYPLEVRRELVLASSAIVTEFLISLSDRAAQRARGIPVAPASGPLGRRLLGFLGADSAPAVEAVRAHVMAQMGLAAGAVD